MMNKKKLNNTFPLLFAEEGQTYLISDLSGGKHFKEKCINQGIIPGQKVEVKNMSSHGPCVVSINDSRIIIGHNMLHRVLIKP